MQYKQDTKRGEQTKLRKGNLTVTLFFNYYLNLFFFPSKNPSKTTVQDTEFNYPRKFPSTVA